MNRSKTRQANKQAQAVLTIFKRCDKNVSCFFSSCSLCFFRFFPFFEHVVIVKCAFKCELFSHLVYYLCGSQFRIAFCGMLIINLPTRFIL